MNIWIELATVAVEVFLPWYFFSGMLGAATGKKGLKITIGLTYFLALALLSFFTDTSLLRALIVMCITYIAVKLYFGARWIEVIYPTVLFFLLAVVTDVLCGTLLQSQGLSTDAIMGGGIGRIIYNSMGKLLHLVCLYIALNVSKYRQDSSIIIKALPLLICQLLSIYIYHQYFVSFLFDRQNAESLEVLALLYINIVICIYFEILNHIYKKQKEAELEMRQLEVQRNHYIDVMERQEETRSLWHDIKKYMTLMEALVSSENKAEAKGYFDDISASFEAIDNTVDTGNTLIDSILTYGMKKAAEYDVEIQPEIWVDNSLAFPSADLFVIMGNTIDNAIEACSHIEDKSKHIVSLSLHQKNHFLLYEISNPYTDVKARKPGKIHGYGLKNVKSCAERCGGDMEISRDNGIFLVSINLNLENAVAKLA